MNRNKSLIVLAAFLIVSALPVLAGGTGRLWFEFMALPSFIAWQQANRGIDCVACRTP